MSMDVTTRRNVGGMPLGGSHSLYGKLRETCIGDWRAYVEHDFVRRLADGSLPMEAFRYYLAQDYIFLIHFARAYGLAVYKADRLKDMRPAAQSLAAILDIEMALHVKFSAEWGLSEKEMEATPEDRATLAYTRYVLEKGNAGDLLDLHVALAPCIIGYAEIATALTHSRATKFDGNPYREWIEMYAGAEYQEVARTEVEIIEGLAERRGGDGRFDALAATFGEATRLEADFWQMGLDASA